MGSGIEDVKPLPVDTSSSRPATDTRTANRLVAVAGVRQEACCNGNCPTTAPSGVTSTTGPIASSNVPAWLCRAKAMMPVAGFSVAGAWRREDPGVAADVPDWPRLASNATAGHRDDRDGRNG